MLHVKGVTDLLRPVPRGDLLCRHRFRHLVNGWRVVSAYVEHAACRIPCSAAPIGATHFSWYRDLIPVVSRWRKDAFIGSVRDKVAEALTLLGLQIRINVVRAELLARKGWRRGGERLSRPRVFTRHVRLRHRTFFNGPQRLARHAVEYVEKTKLGGLGDDVHVLSIVLNREQFGCGSGVVIPQIVMHELEVPQALAGPRVKSEQAIAKQIGSGAVRSVEIVGRGAKREVSYATLCVQREFAPRVVTADVFPGFRRKCVVAEFARVWHRVERPGGLSGMNVICANIARRRSVHFAGRRTQNN